MYKLTKKLIKKSNDAFLISLEVFNKPTFSYRTESFSFLFTNAWELLLKAYIYQENKGKKLSIFRRKRRNVKRESISLDECLNRVFLDSLNPVRKNIEFISDIRNEAAHLIVQELDPYFSRTFQAGVLNYINYLKKWFNIDLGKKFNPGLISLISDSTIISDIKTIKSKHNKEDFKSILEWISKYNNLEKLGTEGALSIKYTIAITKNPKNADYIISSGSSGKKEVIILNKPKDPDITHPYKRTFVLAEIKSRIPKDIKFSPHSFQAYLFVKGYRKSNNIYYWHSKVSETSQFSMKLIDEIVQAINKNPKNVEKWNFQYRQHLNLSRKKQI